MPKAQTSTKFILQLASDIKRIKVLELNSSQHLKATR